VRVSPAEYPQSALFAAVGSAPFPVVQPLSRAPWKQTPDIVEAILSGRAGDLGLTKLMEQFPLGVGGAENHLAG